VREFRDGIRLGKNEHEYQSALRQYRSGLVVNLARNRRRLYSLHNANCVTLSYPLEPQRQSHRAPKILFHDRGELAGFQSNNRWLGKLNEGCRYCLR
jgi:hypothetical protein